MSLKRIKVYPNEYYFDFSKPGKVYGALPSSNTSEESAPLLCNYSIKDEKFAGLFGKALSPLLADWIDVALAAHLADRLSQRRSCGNQQSSEQWGRVIHLKIPVRMLKDWRRQEVCKSLQKLLFFLTEDKWLFEFIQHENEKRFSETQKFLFQMPPTQPLRVALFSGGLDSFVGAIRQIKDMPNHSFILVSASNNNRKQAVQKLLHSTIARVSNQNVEHNIVSYELQIDPKYKKHKTERTQRSRGFLFLTFGAITALCARVKDLYIYENGVGAINLPYVETQKVASNSRAVHPITLNRMEGFIKHLIGEPFHIKNPFLFQTKAEMCNHPEVWRFCKHISDSFSCEGFPIREEKDKPQCGNCTSCILRRLSLESAGLSAFDISKKYYIDLLSFPFHGNKKVLKRLIAMELQVQKIMMGLKDSDPWNGLIKEFPELEDIIAEICWNKEVNPIDFRKSLLRLYSKYSTEWLSFSARHLLIAPKTAA